MGGDGGVVATNRRYMRGAGTADHTGDGTHRSGEDSKQSESEAAKELMSTCYLTKHKLNFQSDSIVACAFGRLYLKEAAVQALLRRKQRQSGAGSVHDYQKESEGELSHVRKLSELYDVRCTNIPSDQVALGISCPITGKALNGTVPAVVLVPGKVDTPNVLAQSAIQLLPEQELHAEYGPVDLTIRLAPPLPELEQIRLKVKARELKKDKKAKKNKKKRKMEANGKGDEAAGPEQNRLKTIATRTSTGDAARDRVTSSLKSNTVLSSLFTNSDTRLEKSKDAISKKEYKDNLFAR